MRAITAFVGAFLGSFARRGACAGDDARLERFRVAMAYIGVSWRTACRCRLGKKGRSTVRRVAFKQTSSPRIRAVLLDEIAQVEGRLGERDIRVLPNPRSLPHDEGLVKALRELKGARRWPARRLAMELGMNHQTVERILRGSQRIGSRAQAKIADFMRGAEVA